MSIARETLCPWGGVSPDSSVGRACYPAPNVLAVHLVSPPLLQSVGGGEIRGLLITIHGRRAPFGARFPRRAGAPPGHDLI